MGLNQLPDELLLSLSEQWPCREQQVRQLSVLLHPTRPSPSTIVLYGAHATGKSSIVRSYLEASSSSPPSSSSDGRLQHAIIRCRECVTGRHLLERTVAAVHAATTASASASNASGENGSGSGGGGGSGSYAGRCETISALAVHLQHLLAQRPKFVLVFDGIDQQREAPPTVLPALARLGETVRPPALPTSGKPRSMLRLKLTLCRCPPSSLS